MACFLVPVSFTYRQQFPVMQRQLHPYFSANLFHRALVNEVLFSSGGCDCPPLACRPVIRIRRSGPSSKESKSKEGKDSATENYKTSTPCERDGKSETLNGNEPTDTDEPQNKPQAEYFRLAVPVGKLNPDDLKVKVTDHVLTVTGKTSTGSEDDDVYSVISLIRRYKLPKNIDIDGLTSKLTEDGVLMFEAPLLALEEAKEKVIPVAVEGRGELAEEKTENKEDTETESEEPQEQDPVKDDVTEKEADSIELDVRVHELFNFE